MNLPQWNFLQFVLYQSGNVHISTDLGCCVWKVITPPPPLPVGLPVCKYFKLGFLWLAYLSFLDSFFGPIPLPAAAAAAAVAAAAAAALICCGGCSSSLLLWQLLLLRSAVAAVEKWSRWPRYNRPSVMGGSSFCRFHCIHSNIAFVLGLVSVPAGGCRLHSPAVAVSRLLLSCWDDDGW